MSESRYKKIKDVLNKHKLVIKYFITGISASLIDLTLFFFLREYYNIWYLYSAVVALSVSFTTAFIVQKYWTFSDFSDHNIHGQFFWYFFTVITSVTLNLSVLSLLIEVLNFNHMLAQIISLAVAGFAGFIMNVRNVFHNVPTKKGLVFAAGIFPPDIGGPATFVKNLSEKLCSKEVSTTVVTYADMLGRGVETSSCYDVIRISRSLPFGLRHTIYTFWLFLASINHDLIYAQDVTAAGLPALLVKNILGKKMIIRLGGDLLWERQAESGKTDLSMNEFYKAGLHKNKIIFKIGKMVLGGSDTIFVTAENLKRVYVEYYGVDEGKIELLYNPPPDVRGTAISEVPAQKEKIVLFAGRLIKYKNIDKLIDSFLEIYEDIAPARLTIIGGGPEAKNLRDKIKNEAKGKVELIDKLPNKDILEYISRAELCVSAATTEYNPNFILEALALGKKVLLNEENGLTVKLPMRFLFKGNQDLKYKMKDLILDSSSSSIPQTDIRALLTGNSLDVTADRHLVLFKKLGVK
jgi:glycosyltransferase involved in cell wall biosynthesis/putative flippase GtrA